MKITTKEITLTAVFTAIIALCAQISIPMPAGVPMTLQTLIIPLAGVILGKRNGTLSVSVYVLLGLIGIPVFAGFTGGPGMIFGKTGGFILTFPIMALLAGIGADKNNKWLIFWLIIGSAINYLGGMLMFSFVTSNSLIVSFGAVVVPFIPTAIIKIVLVFILSKAVRRIVPKEV